MNRRLRASTYFVTALFTCLLLVGAALAQTPTVTTDKDDYVPGEIVTITGAGWQIGETVALHLEEEPVFDGGHNLTAVADQDGNIFNDQFLILQRHLGVKFTLTATGLTSGWTAQTTFTDDNVQNNVTVGGNDTFIAGGSTTVSYRITATSGDGQSGCNASDGSPAVVTINTPSGVTATPNPLSFSTCGTLLPTTFTSNTPGSYLITVSVSDPGPGTYNTTPATFTLHVLPPPCPSGLAISGSVPNFCEGTAQAISLSVTGSNLAGATITWTLNGTTPLGIGTALSTTLSGLTAGPYTITATASKTGCTNTSASTNFTVNPLPTVSVNSTVVCAGTSATLTATTNAANPSFLWSNGATSPSITVSPSVTTTFSVTVTDGVTGCQKSGSGTVTANTPPTVAATNASVTVDEGTTATNTGTWGDVDAGDNVTLSASAGTITKSGTNASGTWNWSFATTDGPTQNQTVTISANDGTCAAVSTTFSLTVNNVAPTITITAPTLGALYAAPASVSVSASFSDPGTGDTHTGTITWDDGMTTNGIVTETNGSGTCVGTHSYSAAGVYTITVTVTDDDGGAGTATVMVVVYDPSAGFVTGGGWINSPAEAYTADPTLTGKANFGFVSKYQKGKTIPTGETQFQFQMANFNFHSTVYEWLVVSGPKAQYKGSGTVNGVGNYNFLLTATDGQINGGGGVDKFRIKITNGGAVVYDNVPGASDDIDAANPQALGGGSIVIHKGTAKASGLEMDEEFIPTDYAIYQNYPNPFNPTTQIQFDLPENSRVKIVIYNMLGRAVTTLLDEEMPAGRYRKLWNGQDRSGQVVPSGVYIYRIDAKSASSDRQLNVVKRMVFVK